MWYIRYGLGGGFGGCGDWEEARWAFDKTSAYAEAEEEARSEYESYGNLHGLFDYDIFMEENPDATEEDAELEREQDMESWIEYEVMEK